MEKKIGFLGFGIMFGFALSRVGASEYDLIFGMFTGENFKLAWVIITAIVVGYLGMRVLKARGQTTVNDKPLKINYKKLGRWSLLGAVIFGLGWGITGACPGTVLAQLGEGKFYAIFTFSGMIYGTYLYAVLKERMPEL